MESKGLTAVEIEDAIRQASVGSSVSGAPSVVGPSQVQLQPQQYAPSYAPSTYTMAAPPPAVPRLDWRDYFVSSPSSLVGYTLKLFYYVDNGRCLRRRYVWRRLSGQGGDRLW